MKRPLRRGPIWGPEETSLGPESVRFTEGFRYDQLVSGAGELRGGPPRTRALLLGEFEDGSVRVEAAAAVPVP